VKKLQIKIYQTEPSDPKHKRKLIRHLEIENESDKRLTAARASKIIKRELPEFCTCSSVIVIKTEEGWQASRAIKPSDKCKFHYFWEYAVISE